MVSDRRMLAEFDAAYPRFVAVAHRAIRGFFRYDTSKVDDAVAETMARTFARWETVRGQESPHGWVVVCAKDVCLEHLRADAHDATSATVRQYLNQLPRRQRNVAVLRELMGFSTAATARALGTTVTNVETATEKASGAFGPHLREVYAGRARFEGFGARRVYEHAIAAGTARRQRRRRGYVAGLAVLTVVVALSTVPRLATAPAAHLPPVAPQPEATADGTTFAAMTAKHATAGAPRAILALGDSVMLGAQTTLEATIPNLYVDAKISRGIGDAADVLRQYKRAGILPSTVVIALATNGTFTDAEFIETMQVLAGRRAIFLNALMPRPWESEVNRRLAFNVKKYRNARLVDWHRIGSAHPEWFVADGTHLNPAGKRGYDALIRSSL